MENNGLIIDKKAYHRLYHALRKEKVTDNTKDTKYVGIIIDSVHEMLYSFGLPDINEYRSIIENGLSKLGPGRNSLKKLEEKLKEAATKYLSSPAKINQELLEIGRANDSSAFEVLALMDIGSRNYNLFIYEDLWIKRAYPMASILNEFETYNKIPEPEQMFLFRTVMNAKANNILRCRKLQFVDEYTKYVRNQHYLSDGDFSDDFKFPFQFEIKESFWSRVEFFTNDSARIDMQVFINETWQEISVFLYFDALISLLANCVQLNFSLSLLECIESWMEGNHENSKFNLKNFNKQYLQCNAPFAAMQMEEEYDQMDPIPLSTYILLAVL